MAIAFARRDELAQRLRSARGGRGLSYQRLGSLAGIDPAQALRICRGEFKTLSPNVVRICNALGVELEKEDGRPAALPADGAERRLQAELLETWDRSEADEHRLVELLRLARRFRDAAGAPG